MLVGLTPAIAWSVNLMFASRLAVGVTQGALYPIMHKLFDKWAPPNEIGKFTATLMGGSFGTITSWMMSGVLIETFGWPYSFYGTATLTLAFCVIWWLVAYDSPARHPRITDVEREYIESTLVNSKKIEVRVYFD